MVNIRLLATAACVGIMSATASVAATMTWYLDNVTYADGQSASGSFGFDADTGNFSQISVTNGDGQLLAFVNPVAPGNASYLNFVAAVPAVPGTSASSYFLQAAMTNAGGEINIVSGSRDVTCGTLVSGDLCAANPPSRFVVSGAITTTLAAVPLPAGGALLLSGVIGLAAMRRRSRAAR